MGSRNSSRGEGFIKRPLLSLSIMPMTRRGREFLASCSSAWNAGGFASNGTIV